MQNGLGMRRSGDLQTVSKQNSNFRESNWRKKSVRFQYSFKCGGVRHRSGEWTERPSHDCYSLATSRQRRSTNSALSA